jgi:hypothetical protein
MAVHVWSKDGDYLGQIAGVRHEQLGVSDNSNKELMRALDVLMGRPPRSDMGGFEIRFGNQRPNYLEFATEGWLDVAAILYLPPAGFRVHVIREAVDERTI